MSESQGTMAKVFNSLCLFLQVAGLGIAIAGVAILQSNCNGNISDRNFNGVFGLGFNNIRSQIGLLGAPTPYDCGMQLSWYWWVLALELVCFCAGLLANFTSLRKGKLCILSFYGTANALWAVFAYAMLYEVYVYQAWDQSSFKNNKWAQGYAAGGAGAIIALVGNYIFSMIFGWDDGPSTFHKEEHTAAPAGFTAA